MKKNLLIIAVVAISSFAFDARASAPNAKALLEAVQKNYKKIQSLSAKFEQTYTSVRFPEKTAYGVVAIQKPRKMRWDYKEPKGKVVVSDGDKITLYDPEDRQAMVSSAKKSEELPLILSFLWGEKEITNLFDCKTWVDESKKEKKKPKEKEPMIHCVPKETLPNVKEVFLTVQESEPKLLKTSRIVDAMGGANEISLFDIKVNPKIEAGHFQYRLPKGTHIVSFGDKGIKR